MKKNINKYFLIPILFTTLFAAPLSTDASVDDVHMSYLYGANSNTSLKNIDKTLGAINTVTPGFYELYADGSLKSSIDTSFIEQAHKRGLKVVPFISNHWDRDLAQIAMANRENLTTQIANSIIKNNLDGIDIDIENLNYTDKDAFTDFIRLLDKKLPNDKIISIAVAANPNNWSTGWHGSYDYPKLSAYSDYLMVMSYDESYNGGPVGPVGSLSFVERSIQSLLNQGVDSKKIVMGLPFYGRIWNDAEKIGGDGVANKVIPGIVNKHNGKFYFDPNSKSAYAKFSVKSSDSPTIINGNKLAPGNYTIWYDNDLTLKYKLRLVEKYNLKGTGSWDLNQANSGIWKFYSAWANGEHHFIDSENHWAEKDIMSLFKKGWINGKNEFKFDPNGDLTRAEAVTILVKAIGLDAKNQLVPNYFTDVPSNYWAKQSIELANQYNIVNGTDLYTFEPNARITRAQIAAILSRVVDYPTNTPMDSPFYDVLKGHWAYADILKLSSHGIIKGKNEGEFSPDDFVSRAEIAVMVNRASADFKNY
ncbi:MAG: glycosyl hydrolase family 18 protein [Solibacillus sp.]